MPGITGRRRIGKSKSKGGERRRDRREQITQGSFGNQPDMEIIQKYLEPEEEREKAIEEKKREIMAAKQAREERRRKEMKEAAASRVSYVRKPFARRSRMSAALTAEALICGGVGIYEGVVTQGKAELICGALGFCSMFLSLIALWYGAISFLEEDKNYILAKVGIVISILLLAGWTYIIIIGLGG